MWTTALGLLFIVWLGVSGIGGALLTLVGIGTEKIIGIILVILFFVTIGVCAP